MFWMRDSFTSFFSLSFCSSWFLFSFNSAKDSFSFLISTDCSANRRQPVENHPLQCHCWCYRHKLLSVRSFQHMIHNHYKLCTLTWIDAFCWIILGDSLVSLQSMFLSVSRSPLLNFRHICITLRHNWNRIVSDLEDICWIMKECVITSKISTVSDLSSSVRDKSALRSTKRSDNSEGRKLSQPTDLLQNWQQWLFRDAENSMAWLGTAVKDEMARNSNCKRFWRTHCRGCCQSFSYLSSIITPHEVWSRSVKCEVP